MSAKPASVPRWASSGGAIVVPSSGKQDIGWLTGERPPAQYLNWIENLSYQWLQYLSDAAFSGAATFDNTLGVTGLITATAGLTAAANQHVTVSGTGRHKHGTMTLEIPGSAYVPLAGVAAAGAPVNVFGAITNTAGTFMNVLAPLVLPVGARILAIRTRVTDNATGTSTMVAVLRSNLNFGTTTAINTSAATLGNGTNQTISQTGLTTTIAAATSYTITVSQTAGTAACTLYGTEVDYDMP